MCTSLLLPLQFKPNQKGFTLVELMITLVISSVIMAAIYGAYRFQQHQYANQSQVLEMQQNIRAAIEFMAGEIRMAGYDPTGSAGAGFIQADINRIHFTKDTTDATNTAVDGDGVLDGIPTMENILFGFRNADDADNDGIADNGFAPLSLSRDNGNNFQTIADNIHAIEFSYVMSDGSVLTTTNNFQNIESVNITILARPERPDQEFLNTLTYTTAFGNVWGPFNDNFRRRLLVTNLRCRNMGL